MSIVVLVIEEFGFGHWRWRPGLEERDLLAWMRGLDIEDGKRLLFMDLPGRLERVSDAEQSDFHESFGSPGVYSAHLHGLDDSYIRTPDGRVVRPLLDADVQSERAFEAWDGIQQIWQDIEGAGTLAGIEALLSSAESIVIPEGPPRSELSLHWSQIGPGLGELLAKSAFSRTLRELDVTGNQLVVEDFVALGTLRVRSLTVEDGVDGASLTGLLSNHELHWLDLGGQVLTAAHQAALHDRKRPLSLHAVRPPGFASRQVAFTDST